MRKFWRKSAFRPVFFVILIILIPLISYLLKSPILSRLPSNLTSKPTVVKPGTCLILEEKYCSQAKVIDWTNPAGQKVKIIGFRLPAGVSIFMPIDGQIAKAKLNDKVVFFKGFQAIVFDTNHPYTLMYKFTGGIQFDNMFSLNMKKGDNLGHIQNTSIDMLGYNFVFYIANTGSDGWEITNIEEVKKIFPTIKL